MSTERRVYIGIDFGTSNTKVAYSMMGDRMIRPLIFNHGLASDYFPPFCLPSLATFNRQGKLLLGDMAAHELIKDPQCACIYSLKMLLAGGCAEEFRDHDAIKAYKKAIKRSAVDKNCLSPSVLTVAYLLYVMRLAVQLLEREYVPRGVHVSPVFFVCMPIHHMQCAGVRKEFERVLAVCQSIYDKRAEKAERKNGVGKRLLREIARTLERENLVYDETADNTRVFFKPETIAQIASYRVSPARENGLHALVDIGAGTTDIAILNLRNTRETNEILEVFGWLNLPIGSRIIENRIAKDLSKRRKPHSVLDVLQALSSGEKPMRTLQLIHEFVKELWASTKSAWGGAYKFALEARGMNANDWRGDKVNVLLCGGGAKLPYVEETFSESHIKYQKSMDFEPNPTGALPTPVGRFDRAPGAPFDRMAIAYGLAIQDRFSFDLDPVSFQRKPAQEVVERGIYDGDHLIPNQAWLGARRRR